MSFAKLYALEEEDGCTGWFVFQSALARQEGSVQSHEDKVIQWNSYIYRYGRLERCDLGIKLVKEVHKLIQLTIILYQTSI